MSRNIELEDALKAWISQVMRFSMRGFIEFATESKLSMPQIAVLFRLNGDKRCAVTELGEEFGVSGAAASQMVEKLSQMGLIERIEDANDRRVKRLFLTQKGKKIVEKSIEARQEWIAHFSEAFSSEEAREAIALLQEFTARANKLSIGIFARGDSARGHSAHDDSANGKAAQGTREEPSATVSNSDT